MKQVKKADWKLGKWGFLRHVFEAFTPFKQEKNNFYNPVRSNMRCLNAQR